MSLVELVEKVREKLAVQNDACAQFNLALTQMGFVESDPQALRFYRPGNS